MYKADEMGLECQLKHNLKATKNPAKISNITEETIEKTQIENCIRNSDS